ncbi:Two component sensor histidine kinase DevS [Mycobacterium tuberculosis str. Haarlem/NITR202]|uniref:Two component sensor histidine kinase DevS n=1 Tax=Mycobacterium tuberculosis str. Haarlem/NITR202 TaxID=1304279 RepID=R4LZ71_MYCTX|nr:Two component sensor histidine kinase DevS [Mycobacterium tuberculosis str. Haarlem/NITR202]
MRPLRHTLSQLRLHELLVEVQDRVEQIVEGRDRLDGLVEAMLVVTAGLDAGGNPTRYRAFSDQPCRCALWRYGGARPAASGIALCL